MDVHPTGRAVPLGKGKLTLRPAPLPLPICYAIPEPLTGSCKFNGLESVRETLPMVYGILDSV